MQQDSSPVLFSTLPTACGHVWGRVTLNKPATLNALTLDMVNLLYPQLLAWQQDPQVVGIWLEGVGEKAFCAGGDVVAMYHAIRSVPAGQVPKEARVFFEREYRLDHLIHTYNKPVVCWGHGIVMGGGMGLMAGASHRVVTAQTRMAMPEVAIGLYPDVGGSYMLSRAPGKVGAFLAVTGVSIHAADALFAGLADVALAHESKDEVIKCIQQARWQGERSSDDLQLDHMLQAFSIVSSLPDSAVKQHLDLINQVMSSKHVPDMAHDMQNLLSHPDPWVAKAAQGFVKGSPTSVALGLYMQEQARHMNLADVFRLELQASLGCCAHADFAEGVRALLVDKDKSPQWSPASHDLVTQDWVLDHVKPRFDGPHPLADLKR